MSGGTVGGTCVACNAARADACTGGCKCGTLNQCASNRICDTGACLLDSCGGVPCARAPDPGAPPPSDR